MLARGPSAELPGLLQLTLGSACRGFYIFIFYIFIFYKNIFSIWKFIGIYPGRPAAGWPGPDRPAAERQGHFRKKFRGENCAQVPGGRSPGSGVAGPGRPALPPLYKGWLVPPTLHLHH